MDGALFVSAVGRPGRILLVAAAPWDGRMLWLPLLLAFTQEGRGSTEKPNQIPPPHALARWSRSAAVSSAQLSPNQAMV